MSSKNIVIVGGGIAGLSCLEGLALDFDRGNPQFGELILISESRILKRVTNYVTTGRNLEQFTIEESDVGDVIGNNKFPDDLPIKFINGQVAFIDYVKKIISVNRYNVEPGQPSETNLTELINYDVICLCNGSRPKVFKFPNQSKSVELSERLITIRDTTTVESLGKKLSLCKRLAIVGNGGISLELVSKITDCGKTWIIKDKSIGLTFFDPGAGKFLLEHGTYGTPRPVESHANKLTSNRYSATPLPGDSESSRRFGPSLGPDWLHDLNLKGQSSSHDLKIIYDDEIEDIQYDPHNRDHPVVLKTKRGITVSCDLVVLAIGVEPNSFEIRGGKLKTSSSDSGVLIDDQMRTSLDGIYAAGDVVSCDNWSANQLWFQMRLWTQARQMGFYAGRCIASHLTDQDPSIYFNFDCFTHCTTFFGQKLILIGRYNGQNMTEDEYKTCEIIARVLKGKDYIKLFLKSDRIIGAVLIGDTGLEETIENLVHDQINVGDYKERLLDGSVDIEDYFD